MDSNAAKTATLHYGYLTTLHIAKKLFDQYYKTEDLDWYYMDSIPLSNN